MTSLVTHFQKHQCQLIFMFVCKFRCLQADDVSKLKLLIPFYFICTNNEQKFFDFCSLMNEVPRTLKKRRNIFYEHNGSPHLILEHSSSSSPLSFQSAVNCLRINFAGSEKQIKRSSERERFV